MPRKGEREGERERVLLPLIWKMGKKKLRNWSVRYSTTCYDMGGSLKYDTHELEWMGYMRMGYGQALGIPLLLILQ